MQWTLNRGENRDQGDETAYCFWLHYKQDQRNHIHLPTDIRIHIHKLCGNCK